MAAAAERRRRVAVGALVLGCVAVAAYTGLRMPSRWAVTLQAVSLQDGFHRRFLVGSLLHPVASRTGYPYTFFVVLSFAVLAVLLAVLVRLAVVTRIPLRRLLVLAFLLLPTGGYLFNEIGYFDQILYLMLFGALWLLGRGRWRAAAAVMACTATVHEIALVTVLPVFFLAAVRTLPWRRAVLAALPAAGVGLAVLLVPPSTGGAPGRFARVLHATGFPVRSDALDLFARSQQGSWQYFKPTDILVFLLPLIVVMAAGVLAFARAGRRPQRLPWLSAGAALAPAALIFGGWDQERWAFLLIANFCVVLWFWLGDHGAAEITPAHYSVVLVVLLLTVHVPMDFFDGYRPRPLTGRGVEDFYHFVHSGDFFATPRL